MRILVLCIISSFLPWSVAAAGGGEVRKRSDVLVCIPSADAKLYEDMLEGIKRAAPLRISHDVLEYDSESATAEKIDVMRDYIFRNKPSGLIVYFETHEMSTLFFEERFGSLETLVIVRDEIPPALPAAVSVVGSRDVLSGVALVEELELLVQGEEQILGLVLEAGRESTFRDAVEFSVSQKQNMLLRQVPVVSLSESTGELLKTVNPDQYDAILFDNIELAQRLVPYIAKRVTVGLRTSREYSEELYAGRSLLIASEDLGSVGREAMDLMEQMLSGGTVDTVWVSPLVQVHHPAPWELASGEGE